MFTDLIKYKGTLIKFAISTILIVGIGLPAILTVRHKFELKDSALDVVTAVQKAQDEAKNRKENVALAIDTTTGVCTAFVDDGAVSYEKKNHLPMTPERANNLKLDPNEEVLFRERIHRIDVVKNDREHPFPKTQAVGSASGELVGGILIDGRLYPGVEFNAQGLPTNLGAEENGLQTLPRFLDCRSLFYPGRQEQNKSDRQVSGGDEFSYRKGSFCFSASMADNAINNN